MLAVSSVKTDAMTRYMLTVLSICLLSFCACRKTVVGPGKDGHVAIAQCKEFAVDNETVSVCLEQVLNDSRCPANANCIWAGSAVVRLKVQKGNRAESVVLATFEYADYKRAKPVMGYLVEMLDLYPYPELGPNPLPRDYVAEVRVTKL